MKQFEIIKRINKIMLDSGFNVNLDGDVEKFKKGKMVIKYIAKTEQDLTLARTEFGGTVRVSIFAESPTLCYKTYDELKEFLSKQYKQDLYFEEIAIIASPFRMSVNEEFELVVDYSATICNV